MSSPQGERQAVAEARAAAERFDVFIDVDQLTTAIGLYTDALDEYGFTYAATKLVHDIAVMATEDHMATPVALAALTSLCGMRLPDEHVHALARAVHDARNLLDNLTPSALTTTVTHYEDLRQSLRAQGQVGILITLTSFLEAIPS